MVSHVCVSWILTRLFPDANSWVWTSTKNARFEIVLQTAVLVMFSARKKMRVRLTVMFQRP